MGKNKGRPLRLLRVETRPLSAGVLPQERRTGAKFEGRREERETPETRASSSGSRAASRGAQKKGGMRVVHAADAARDFAVLRSGGVSTKEANEH